MLVKRTLIWEKHEDYDVVFVVVTEQSHRSGCIDKVKESFLELLFEESGYPVCVDEGCRYQDLFRLSGRVYSLETEIKRISREGQTIQNNISVTKIWGEIDDNALPILVLLEKFNNFEGFHIRFKKIPSLKIMVVNQDKYNFNVSDDNSIIDKLICGIKKVILTINTMAIIENSLLANADFPNNLLSCRLIRKKLYYVIFD